MSLFKIQIEQKRYFKYILLLIIISILPRILVYTVSVYTKEIQIVTSIDRLYYEGLRYHFLEYLWYTTNIPPLTHILNGIIFRLFIPELAYGKFLFLIFIFILDVLSVYLLFSTACKFGFHRGISFFIAVFYSMTIIPYEVWRFGTHYDHYTLFFTVLYIHSMSRIYSSNNMKNILFMSLAGASMVAQSSVSSVIVPVVSVTVVAILSFKQSYKELFKKTGMVLLCPVIVILLIASKNYLVAGNFATSTKSGPAMMMFVRRALGNDNEVIRKILQEAGVPEWYLYCFDNSTIPPHITLNNPSYKGWLALAKDFGICFPWSPVQAETWPFDFQPLRDYLHERGSYDIEKLVAMDQNDMRNKKYLLAGYSQELSPRWIGMYGQASLQVGKHLLMTRPVTYLKNILRTHILYFGRGPAFFRMMLYSNSKPHSLSTLSRDMFGEKLFFGITSAYELLARVIYLLIPVYFIMVSRVYLINKKNNFKQTLVLTKRNLYVFIYIATPMIMFLSIIFSSMSDIQSLSTAGLSTVTKYAFGKKFFYGLILIPVYFLMVSRLYLNIKSKIIQQRIKLTLDNLCIFIFLSVPVVLISLIFSSTADRENDRYFVQITPYLMLLLGYFLMLGSVERVSKRQGKSC